MHSRQLLLRPSPAGRQLQSQQKQNHPAHQTATKRGDARRQAHGMRLGDGLLPPQAGRVSRRLAPAHRSHTITHTLPGGRRRRRDVLRRDASAHAHRKDGQQEHHSVETKSSQPSAQPSNSWLSEGPCSAKSCPSQPQAPASLGLSAPWGGFRSVLAGFGRLVGHSSRACSRHRSTISQLSRTEAAGCAQTAVFHDLFAAQLPPTQAKLTVMREPCGICIYAYYDYYA